MEVLGRLRPNFFFLNPRFSATEKDIWKRLSEEKETKMYILRPTILIAIVVIYQRFSVQFH